MLPAPRWLLFLPVFFSSVTAAALAWRSQNVKIKHEWLDLPRGWHVAGDAPADHVLELRIALKNSRFDELVEHLYQVSDPAHERYGMHLSKEQVHALVAPHEDTVSVVEEWLVDHGIVLEDVQRSSSGEWLACRVSVAQAERMLNTRYRVYRHADSGEHIVRTMSYSLPVVLHDHVQVVAPTTYFGSLRPLSATNFLEPNEPSLELEEKLQWKKVQGSSSVPASCNSSITPACLQALYKINDYKPQATNKNKIGVTGYLGQFINDADLAAFLKIMRPDAVGATYALEVVNGGINDQSRPGSEAALDIQYVEALTFPTPNIYYSTGGSPPFNPDSMTQTDTNEPYLDWLNYIKDQEAIPQTITTSYGDDEQSVPLDYATSVCNLFAQLGSRGVSVIFSSGDFGVGGGDCMTNDGKQQVRYQPAFPASCPYVTSVGATRYINPEVAVAFSGGGFSNYFAQPKYQEEAVENYLATLGNDNAGLFNKTGRAYPDIAAQGVRFQIVLGGKQSLISGTSASAPTVGGIISLLNDHRIAAGKSSLGFLNPLLYSKTAVTGFNDITSGNNPGCGTSGFAATKGWDPVTGVGTPNFQVLQEIVCRTEDVPF